MRQGAHAYDRGRPPHGTMAEEAVKLAEVAQVWLRARSARERADDVWAAATAEPVQHPPECEGCPYCRLRRAFADVNPEVYAHLADAAGSLAAALRALSGPRDGTGTGGP